MFTTCPFAYIAIFLKKEIPKLLLLMNYVAKVKAQKKRGRRSFWKSTEAQLKNEILLIWLNRKFHHIQK